MWENEPGKNGWEKFISYYSKPRRDTLLKSEAPFFRKAWAESPDGKTFRAKISSYQFEVVKDESASYCIATNDGRYFSTEEFGVSQKEAARKIGSQHGSFKLVQDAAQNYADFLKSDIPSMKGSFDLLSDGLQREQQMEAFYQKLDGLRGSHKQQPSMNISQNKGKGLGM